MNEILTYQDLPQNGNLYFVGTPNASFKTPSLYETRNIVYSITNRINGMRYIGKTTQTFNKRYKSAWYRHTSNKLLKRDYEKFGSEAFEVEILEYGYDEKELLLIESHYIYYFNSFTPNGYNLHYDTDPLDQNPSGGILYIAKLSEGKIYVFQKDKGDNRVDFYLNRNTGHPCSEAQKKQISLANKGRVLTLEHHKILSEKKLGKKLSPESIRKRSLKAFKPVIRLDANNNVIEEYPSVMVAAESLKTDRATVSHICAGRRKRSGTILKFKT